MNRPLVSVVMCVYNAEKYLQEAIESILRQTYRNLEFIIVNDGSTDSTRDIILGLNDPRIRYFENPENWGIVRTRNQTLKHAKGKYISVIDSDDISLPDRLTLQVDFLENNPEYGMCGSYFQTIDGSGKRLKDVIFPANDRDARTFLMIHNCFCHSTVTMRGDMARELQYQTMYDVAEDYELWYRVSRISKIINIPHFTTYYRVHGSNISISKREHMFLIVDSINRRILDDLQMPYTEEELRVHSNSLHYDEKFFQDEAKMDELEKWYLKFHLAIENNPVFSEDIIYKALAEKWIVLCYNAGHKKKLLFNQLIRIHPLVYFKILYRKIRKNLT